MRPPFSLPPYIAALALCLAGTSCDRPVPRVIDGREQKPYDDPAAPLALIQVSHIGSRTVQIGTVLQVENRTVIEGQVERFPAFGLLYTILRTSGKKWHVIPVSADVSPAGEWKVSAELIAGGAAYETKADLKAIITRQPPQQLDLDDAQLRAISYQSSSQVTVIVMPDSDGHGAVSLTIDQIQGQAAQAESTVFAPIVFGASGSVHNLPLGAVIWVAAQCGHGEWQVIATAQDGQQHAWSIENAAWPYRGRESSVMCRLSALVRYGKPPKEEAAVADLERGALATAGPYPATITPARLEVVTITGGDWRERRVAEEIEVQPVIPNISPRVQIQVAVSRARAGDYVYLTLQPASSVRTLIFGPGRRTDDGLWLFDRVPMVFPGYPDSKVVLVGAILSDTPLQGRALTQSQLAETGLGYAPLVHVAAAPTLVHIPSGYVVTSPPVLTPARGPEVLDLDMVTSEIQGEWNEAGGTPPLVGQRADNAQWRFQRAERVSRSTWRTTLSPLESDRGGVNGQLAVLDGTEDLTLVEFVDSEWLRAFGFGSQVTIPVHLPRKPWLVRFRHWTTTITEPTGEIDMMKILMQILAIVMGLGVFAGLLLLVPRWFSRCGDWWQAFRDARRNQPACASNGPAEQRISQRYVRQTAKVLARYGGRIAVVRAAVESIERRMNADQKDLAQKQHDACRLSPDVHLSPRWKLTLTSTMILGENAFNLTAFDVFHQPFLETVIMAVSVGVAVPISAQLVGVWMRQFPRPVWRTALQMVTVLTLMIWILQGLNSVRIMVLQGKDPEFLIHNPNLGAAVFPVNVAVLLASAIAVYMSLDAIPGFVEVYNRVLKLERRVARATGKLRKLESRQKSRSDYWEAAHMEALAYYRMINDRHRSTARAEALLPAAPEKPVERNDAPHLRSENKSIQAVAVATEFKSTNGTGAKHGD